MQPCTPPAFSVCAFSSNPLHQRGYKRYRKGQAGQGFRHFYLDTRMQDSVLWPWELSLFFALNIGTIPGSFG